MSEPLVSIVIPVFNQRPDFLRAAIGSALGQTYEHLEVIVSDNHSAQDVSYVTEAFGDGRLRLVRPPEHLPMVAHFAFAAEQSRGEYMSFLCSDDWVYPRWLEWLLPLLIDNPQVSFGFGEIENVPHEAPDTVNYFYRENSLPTGIYTAAEMLVQMMRLDRASGWLVGDLMRVDAYRQAGGIGRDRLSYCADYALALRLLELGGAVAYVNRPLGKNRAWGAQDGKSDALRVHAAAEDVAVIYEVLANSEPLRTVVEQAEDRIRAARVHKARLLALGLLAAVATGEVAQAKLERTRACIRRIGEDEGFTRLLLMASAPALHGVLPLLYRPALHLARSRLGRRLLRL